MAGGLRKLGAAFVEIFADTKRLDADLQQAKTEVSASTQKMGDDVKKNVGGGFEATLKPLNRFRETLTKTVGIVGLIVAPLVAAARVTVELSKAAMGVNREFSNSLDTLRGLQDQVQVIRDKIAGVYDDQAKQIAELKNQIAQLGSVTLQQQREQASMLAKLLDTNMIDPTSTTLGDGIVKTLGEALQGMSELTGLGQGFYEDMAAAAKAQRDAIDKGVSQTIRAAQKAESELRAKQIRETEEATRKLAERNAATAEKLLNMVAGKDIEAIAATHREERQLAAIAHAARMDNIAKEHERVMRLQDEYFNRLRGQFTDLGGLRALRELPDIVRKLSTKI